LLVVVLRCQRIHRASADRKMCLAKASPRRTSVHGRDRFGACRSWRGFIGVASCIETRLGALPARRAVLAISLCGFPRCVTPGTHPGLVHWHGHWRPDTWPLAERREVSEALPACRHAAVLRRLASMAAQPQGIDQGGARAPSKPPRRECGHRHSPPSRLGCRLVHPRVWVRNRRGQRGEPAAVRAGRS
jgi:hypothetical protein